MTATSSSQLAIEEELTLVDSSPGAFCIRQWRNLSIIVWLAPANRDSATRVMHAGQEAARRFPKGRAAVSFVVPGIAGPTPEGREILAQGFNRSLTEIQNMAIVLEGGGFWASGIRSAITNMRLTSKDSGNVLVCGSIDEVADWLPARHTQLTGVHVTRATVRDVLQAARSACI